MTDENTLPEGWVKFIIGVQGERFFHFGNGEMEFHTQDEGMGIRIASALSRPTIEDAKAKLTQLHASATSVQTGSFGKGYSLALLDSIDALDNLSPTPAPDLTQNTTPLGLLPKETQEALKALPEGAVKLWCWEVSKWCSVRQPVWALENIYRQNPDWTPEPLTQPNPPWDVLVDWVQWVVRDPSGEFFGFETMPVAGINNWIKTSDCVFISSSIIKFDPGTCDWRDSLVMRPKEST